MEKPHYFWCPQNPLQSAELLMAKRAMLGLATSFPFVTIESVLDKIKKEINAL